MKSLAAQFLLSTILLCCGCESFEPKHTSVADFISPNTSLMYAIDDISQISKEFNNNELNGVMETSPLERVINKYPFISKLPFASEIVIALPTALDTTSNVLVIAKNVANELLDTIAEAKQNNVKKGIFKEQYGTEEVFQSHVGDFVLISPMKEPIQQALAPENSRDTLLEKLVSTNIHKGISTYYKNAHYNNSKTLFSNWNTLNLTFTSKGVHASGIAIKRDSLALLSAFKGQNSHPLRLGKMIPANAERGIIFGYSNASLLHENLNSFKQDSTRIPFPEVFETIKTIGQIVLPEGKITILESLDAPLSLESLSAHISEKEIYKDTQLYHCSAPKFVGNTFSPLLEKNEIKVLFNVDNYIIGANSQTTAEQYINNIKTNSTLSETSYFKDASDELPSNASILIFEQVNVAGFSNQVLGGRISEKKAKKFPIAILQYQYDTSFAHIDFMCQQASKKVKKSQGVSQVTSLDVPQQILGNPTLFTNHKSKEKELVIQDIENKLHLYALNGKKLWSRTLANPILGEIHEIDLLRNGKKQIAFVTKSKMYVLDRNGKDVAPFPITFKDKITQPLALFDYNNNRKYRFVIVQGKEVVMLDSKGKSVKGFTFKKAKSTIIGVPQHIRLQNKDYLLFQQKDGTLSILSRTGKQRINISEKLQLTGNPVQKTRTSFVLLTKDNEKKTISQRGKISTKKLQTSNDYYLNVVKNNTISLTDNQLRVNGKLIELPFGIYTAPTVYYANNKGYIGFTETQEKKLYVYDFKGSLYKGFPVYGTSEPDIITSNKNVLIATKEAANKIVVYKIK